LICYALVTGEDELWIRLLLKRTTEEVEKAQFGVENCRISSPLPQMSTLLGPAWWPSTKAVGLSTEAGTF